MEVVVSLTEISGICRDLRVSHCNSKGKHYCKQADTSMSLHVFFKLYKFKSSLVECISGSMVT